MNFFRGVSEKNITGHLRGPFFWRGSESFGKNGYKMMSTNRLFLGIRKVENPRKVSIFYPIKNIPDRTADGLILSSAAIRIEIWFPQV